MGATCQNSSDFPARIAAITKPLSFEMLPACTKSGDRLSFQITQLDEGMDHHNITTNCSTRPRF